AAPPTKGRRSANTAARPPSARAGPSPSHAGCGLRPGRPSVLLQPLLELILAEGHEILVHRVDDPRLHLLGELLAEQPEELRRRDEDQLLVAILGQLEIEVVRQLQREVLSGVVLGEQAALHRRRALEQLRPLRPTLRVREGLQPKPALLARVAQKEP